MSKKGYDFWKYINTYEELLKVGKTHIGVLFELYQSKEGQLGSSQYKPEEYHEPNIRSLDGVKANSVTPLDISEVLFQTAKFQLKGHEVTNSLDVLLKNKTVVNKILGDIQSYNILESVGTK